MSENLGRTYRKTVRPSLGGHPGFHPRIERRDGLLIEWDRAVAIRGGLTPYAGVYRPARCGDAGQGTGALETKQPAFRMFRSKEALSQAGIWPLRARSPAGNVGA